MSRAPFIVIDGRLYRWKDILELRHAQLAAAGAAEASQLALFATLHDDRRPPAERSPASNVGFRSPIRAQRSSLSNPGWLSTARNGIGFALKSKGLL
jgi:hypothetical protein